MELSDSEIMEDALDVHEATGLTPRQLAEQRVELWGALKVMTGLCQIKYGNIDADVWREIQKARAILEKCK